MAEKYIVACSGGPDSMALLDQMREQDILVAHVNYHKRKSAYRDEKIVRDFCTMHHIPVFVLSPTQKEPQNFQAWARKVRYDFFVRLARKHHCDAICVAHHKDDHLETYFFQKRRKMLCDSYGLRKESVYRGIRILRPLLTWTKKDCINYCTKHQIPYGIDESNLQDAYTRNQIRHSLVEVMSDEEKEAWVHTIVQENQTLAQKKEQAQRFLESWDRSISTLKDWYILEEWIYQNTQKRMSKKACLDLLKQLQSDALVDLQAYDLESYQGKLYIEKKSKPVCICLPSIDYKMYPGFSLQKEGKTIEGFTVTENDFPLTIRTVRPGDKIELVWGTKRLHRFFIDRKIPKIKRKKWLVIENREHRIIFVPKIGCDVQHFSIKPTAFMVQ